MAKFMGIDYGVKRIGVATSDENGTLAFPKEIIPNDKNIFEKIGNIIKKEKISEIVVGDSKDFKGEANKVAGRIKNFVSRLKESFNLPVSMQKEFLTSVEARRYEDNGRADAKAAALILQRYLDKLNKNL